MINKVFVYGTLKKGNTLRGIDKFGDAEFLGNADTVNSHYKMFSLGAFPAVTLGGEHKVSGEVWEVGNDTFQVLDQIEGFPNFYDRSIVSTTIGDAWMYHITEINQFRADELTPTLRGVLTWIK
jgi:gamma-glutamylcyclotransferase (GGCT)/AIG2-like uncharacterized protein YtfP